MFVWDSDLKGFGVRVRASGIKTYVAQYRNQDGLSRRLVIGRHGVLLPDEARKLALKQLGAVAGGADPVADRQRVRAGKTVSEICDWYLEEAGSGRLLGRNRRPIKPTTVKNDRARIDGHIRPLLGGRAVRTLTLGDVERMQAQIAAGATKVAKKRKGRGATTKGGEGVASRTVATLRTILGHAKRWELIERNPALGVRMIATNKRTRRLSEEEIAALGAAIREAERLGESPVALAAVTLMLMTGFRRGEALGLRYAWVAAGSVRFPDTKTGPQTRPIGRAARALIESQRRREGQVFVFPSDRADTHFVAADKTIARLCALARIERATLHTLRHTFASVAADLGYSELTIAGLLGHASLGVTQRYVHLDKALVGAADEVSARIVLLLHEGSRRSLAA
jgi:integrase